MIVRNMQFRSDIEGLRAIAILLVVAAHAGVPWLSGGFIGVDVFFVLSGFLITGNLVRECATTGHINFLAFYVRRLRRLLPALLLMLLTVGLTSTWILSAGELGEQFDAARMAALWVSNFHFALGDLDYFGTSSESSLYLHTWSLGVEEQFYLLWPALVLWLWARGNKDSLKHVKIGMLVVMVFSLLACVKLTRTHPLLAFYMMPLRAWQFSAGALAWLMLARSTTATPTAIRLAPTIGLLGLMLIVGCGFWLNAKHPYPGAWAILPTLGAVLVVVAGSLSSANRGAYRVLALPPLQWLGRISYSWYLWHWPILLLGIALTGNHFPAYRALLVVISLVLASLSHALVEAPLRRWKRWLEFPRVAALSSLVSMVLVGVFGSYWTQQAELKLRDPYLQRYLAAQRDAPEIYRMGCDDWYRSANVRICDFGSADASHTAVLIGDSHAGQWFPAVRNALAGPGWRLLVITKSSCPMVDESLFYARIGREYTECLQWRTDAIDRVLKIKPELLIVGSATYPFTRQQWTEGTARVLEPLSLASKRIFLLADTPTLPFDGPDCLIRHATRPRWLRLFGTCSAPSKSKQAAEIQHWQQLAAARFPNVHLLDMTTQVCPGGLCRAELDGRVVYRDNQHLSAHFAASLGQRLADVLLDDPASQPIHTSLPTPSIWTAPHIQHEAQ